MMFARIRTITPDGPAAVLVDIGGYTARTGAATGYQVGDVPSRTARLYLAADAWARLQGLGQANPSAETVAAAFVVEAEELRQLIAERTRDGA